jgi:hypothetical protein
MYSIMILFDVSILKPSLWSVLMILINILFNSLPLRILSIIFCIYLRLASETTLFILRIWLISMRVDYIEALAD